MKARLTDQYLESLVQKGNAVKGTAVNTVIWDSNKGAPAGFGVRVTANGVVSFILDYRNAAGKTRRFTIGQWPEWKVFKARERARALRVEIDGGADPMQEKKDGRVKASAASAARTVKDLCDAYMKGHVLINNCVAQQKMARHYIDKEIVPRFGDRKPSEVTMADVSDMRASMAEHKYAANQCFTVLRAAFNKGILWGWCTNNPTKGVKKYREDPRTKWLTEKQLADLDGAITEYGQDSGELIRLLLLSGARRGEWMRAKKEHFDLAHAIWTKPAHTVKERRQENVPLNEATMIVVRRVLANTAKDEPYLFPGAVAGKPRATVRRPWIQILRLAGLAQEYTVAGKRGPLKRWRPTIRLHDLRHSYASWLAEHGTPLKTIGKLLGHQRTETTDRYSHIADKSLRATTNMFGDAITKLVQ